jgi:hypothetical protein
MTNEELTSYLQRMAREITEHTGASCQILTCRTVENIISPFYVGIGSWYERKGMCMDFLETDTARTTAHEMEHVIQPPPDENWKS